jgi:hypothetical protein
MSLAPVLRVILLAPFTPSRLFRAGEQGAWYDPSVPWTNSEPQDTFVDITYLETDE